tara:strand:+ start:1128 stop:1892 length:765 start_codon:yes stop_codon:yes gene_type:complete
MNQVAKKQKTDVALASMLRQDSLAGFNNMDTGDFTLPRIKALMQLSPEVQEDDDKYISGAKPGMILHTGTKTLVSGSKGINVIPCYYKREYVEWSDRGVGIAAPVAIHSVGSSIITTTKKDALGKQRLPNGNYLEETASYFLMQEKGGPGLLEMKSTGLPVSRNWNTMMNSIEMEDADGPFTPAMYSHLYNLTTVRKTNDKGTWYTWNVEMVGPLQDANLYQKAKKFSESVSKGDIQAGHDTDETLPKEGSTPF